eukprot:6075260-Prymnesium_polylepis.1
MRNRVANSLHLELLLEARQARGGTRGGGSSVVGRRTGTLYRTGEDRRRSRRERTGLRTEKDGSRRKTEDGTEDGTEKWK